MIAPLLIAENLGTQCDEGDSLADIVDRQGRPEKEVSARPLN